MMIRFIAVSAGILALIFFLILCADAQAWQYITSNGILITTNEKTITQYNNYWAKMWMPPMDREHRPPKLDEVPNLWAEIDWDYLDWFYYHWQQVYSGLDHKIMRISPRKLRIHIKAWTRSCKDVETPSLPKEFYSKAVGSCIDGAYLSYTSPRKTILIHLGDDPGVGEHAFEFTALNHELWHFFLHMTGHTFGD